MGVSPQNPLEQPAERYIWKITLLCCNLHAHCSPILTFFSDASPRTPLCPAVRPPITLQATVLKLLLRNFSTERLFPLPLSSPCWPITWTGQPSWCCVLVWNLEEGCVAETLFAALSVFIEDKLYKQQMGFYHMWGVKCNARQLFCSLISLLPQGVLDLVLDILGYGSLVDGMIGVDGCGEHTLAVPVGNLVGQKMQRIQDWDKSENYRWVIFVFVPLHVGQLATLWRKTSGWMFLLSFDQIGLDFQSFIFISCLFVCALVHFWKCGLSENGPTTCHRYILPWHFRDGNIDLNFMPMHWQCIFTMACRIASGAHVSHFLQPREQKSNDNFCLNGHWFV